MKDTLVDAPFWNEKRVIAQQGSVVYGVPPLVFLKKTSVVYEVNFFRDLIVHCGHILCHWCLVFRVLCDTKSSLSPSFEHNSLPESKMLQNCFLFVFSTW